MPEGRHTKQGATPHLQIENVSPTCGEGLSFLGLPLSHGDKERVGLPGPHTPGVSLGPCPEPCSTGSRSAPPPAGSSPSRRDPTG